MGWFDFIFRPKKKPLKVDYAPLKDEELERDDKLWLAAKAKSEGKEALKKKEYDKAWKLFNEQRYFYFAHAEKYNIPGKQVIALDAEVHEDLANILRLEGKHTDALVNIVFSVCGAPTKGRLKKVTAYFNRANLKGVSIEELDDFIVLTSQNPSYAKVQNKIREWTS